ncbi:hypothetical protein AK812_SmicGene24045 [Symbiodinium microadriaticum]|uniref:Uncharacterized protein n=1 Tax=Symbiodinium microadriaticum TaxID=2951 RepID=A0A1Q9DFJ4_SYMMI|nr:hypothetical protein AK812_SmicGene24045 [Symbiodinium microadriaticum]
MIDVLYLQFHDQEREHWPQAATSCPVRPCLQVDMLGFDFQKPEVTTVIRWLLRVVLVLFLAWLVRQRSEQEAEEEEEENESELSDSRARSNGLRSRGTSRPVSRLQPRRDPYATAPRQRKGVASGTDAADFDSIIEKVSKPKEMWQPRKSGEPLDLRQRSKGDADPGMTERPAVTVNKPGHDAQGPTLRGHERPVTFITFNHENNLLFSCGKAGDAVLAAGIQSEILPLFVRLLDKDPLVAMYKYPPTGHAAKQRTPIALAVFLCLCQRLESSTGTVKAFIAWALLLGTACLRFAHLQRSVQLRCENSLLSALCKKGKRRQQGVQQPFVWCVPACSAPHVCIAPTLLLEYGELVVAKPDVDFIIPDLQLPKSGRLEPGTPKLARKMSRAKFCDLARSLLSAIGVQDEDLDQLSSYSFRRFMPTLADCLDAPYEAYEARLAVGNWVEATADRVTAQKAGSSMPIRYSDEKAITAGMTKLRMLVSLDIVRQRVMPAAVTWSEVTRLRPSSAKVEKALHASAWRAADDVIPKHASESGSEASDSDGDSSSSSASSLSSSDASAEDLRLVMAGVLMKQAPRSVLQVAVAVCAVFA